MISSKPLKKNIFKCPSFTAPAKSTSAGSSKVIEKQAVKEAEIDDLTKTAKKPKVKLNVDVKIDKEKTAFEKKGELVLKLNKGGIEEISKDDTEKNSVCDKESLMLEDKYEEKCRSDANMTETSPKGIRTNVPDIEGTSQEVDNKLVSSIDTVNTIRAANIKIQQKGKQGSKEKKSSMNKDELSQKDKNKVKKVKAKPNPVRSLTDEEYEEIFTAALMRVTQVETEETAEAEENAAKNESIYIPIEDVVSSSVSTPRETKDQKSSKIHDSQKDGQQIQGTYFKDVKIQKNSVKVVDDFAELGYMELDEKNGGMAVEQQNAAEELQSVQTLNETTPSGSVVDLNADKPVVLQSPPPLKKKQKKKKKKTVIRSDCKTAQPKHLPFSDSKTGVRKRQLSAMSDFKQKNHKKESTVREDRIMRKNKEQIKVNNKKKMLQREIISDGTWVMCCNNNCNKWRHLPHIADPATLPDYWTCNMNADEAYNSCEKAEQCYDESEHIYTKYTEGSIVWARMKGYPLWPAMIEIDPDSETYFDTDNSNAMKPTHYHVVFFDDQVSRAWVRTEDLRQFTGYPEDDIKHVSLKKEMQYKKAISLAKTHAIEALDYSIQRRQIGEVSS